MALWSTRKKITITAVIVVMIMSGIGYSFTRVSASLSLFLHYSPLGIGYSFMRVFFASSPQSAHVGVWVRDVTIPDENRREQVFIMRGDGIQTGKIIGQDAISSPHRGTNAVYFIRGNRWTNIFPPDTFPGAGGRTTFTFRFEIRDDVMTRQARGSDMFVFTRAQNQLVGGWVSNNPVTGETIVNFLSDGTYVEYTNGQVISGSYSVEGNILTIRRQDSSITVDFDEVSKDEIRWTHEGLLMTLRRFGAE